MKMKFGTPLPEGYEINHDDLAASVGALMAQTLLPLFAENMPEQVAKANVEGILTELAYLFDEGEIHIGGKTYRPRIAFVDEAERLMPGAEKLNCMHELLETPFDIEPEANITFDEDAFAEG